MKIKSLENNRGITMPLVIFVFVILLIFGIVLMSLSMSETRNTTWQNNRVQAHYLARSGVHIGIEKIKSELNADEYLGTVQEIATSLNSKFSNPYTIAEAGTYTVNFSVTPANELMISSVGTTALASPTATNTVTFTKKLTKGAEGIFNFDDASSQWFHTNNFSLAPGVLPDSNPDPYSKNFLGRAALIESTKTEMLNPSVGSPSDASVFRASMLAIGEYNGISIEARSNSYGVFDSEIIFINGSIDLSPTNSQIILRISEPVLNQKTPDLYNDKYRNPDTPWSLAFLNHAYPTGFEDDARYESFTGVSRTPLTFDLPENYGVVRIKSIRDNSSKTALSLPGSSGVYSKGYYYFPNNVRLDLESGRSSLIPILDSDPITTILDEFFKWRWTDEGQEMWNNK